MDCRIIRVEQGSDDWLDLRRTRITCSRLADVMAGKDTKRYIRYLDEKSKELCGHKGVEETPQWAEHGKENEGRAMAAYEHRYELEVEHNVFLISEKYDWLSCSPDLFHLPEFDEGGEIKCRALFKNYIKERQWCHDHEGMTSACPAPNRHQVQGAMWVTGFTRWAFINYYIGKIPESMGGGTAQKIDRVWIPRDTGLIKLMEARCIEFMTEAYEKAGLA
jgi:hypothetical protein